MSKEITDINTFRKVSTLHFIIYIINLNFFHVKISEIQSLNAQIQVAEENNRKIKVLS